MEHCNTSVTPQILEMWGSSTREWEGAAAREEDKSGDKSNVFVHGAAPGGGVNDQGL